MWKNKSNWKRNRGGMTNRRHGGQFGRKVQHDRNSRRGDSNRAGYENQFQNDRNYRPETRDYGLDQDRYGGSAVHIGIEIEDGTYNRDNYQEGPITGFEPLELNDDILYRDRRNVDSNLGHYGEIGVKSSDSYWDDGRTQDRYHNRDQELRNDDYFGRRDQRGFVDNLNSFDREFQKHRSEVRIEEQHHDRQGSYRDMGTHHQIDSNRNQHVHSATFGNDDRRGYDNKVSRHNWSVEEPREKRMSFKSRNMKNHRQSNQPKQDPGVEEKTNSSKHSVDWTHSSKKQDSLKTVSKNYKRSSEHSSSTSLKAKGDTGNSKRSESGERSILNKSGDSRHAQKKSEPRKERKSIVTATKNKTSVKDSQNLDKNRQNSAGSRITQIKHDPSIKKEPSKLDKKKGDIKKKSSSSSRVENSSFKKPLEKQHQHRQRNNSGRKVECDTGNVHEEDILSIMADDDGFEREMRLDSKIGAKHLSSRNRGSKERRSQESDAGRSSRDRDGFDKHQFNKCSNSKQSSTVEYNSNIEPLFEIHADSSASVFGELSENVSRSSEFRNQTRRSERRRYRQFTFNSRYKPFGDKDFRQAGGNNNYIGGRSRWSVASKIKDSYLKRRQTYQTFEYRGENNRQSPKPVNVHKQTLSLQQQKHGKNEIGKTGAVLKDDRIRENNRSSDLRKRDRSRSADNRKGNNFDRNSRSFSFKPKFDRNTQIDRFQRERAPFKSRGFASQRVKRKYFRGGFSQNGNNSRNHSNRGKDYNRGESGKNSQWSNRSDDNKNLCSNELGQENLPEHDQQLDNHPLDPSQPQVIFIPNADLQTSQPQMIDQFGQILMNPDNVEQNEAQVPVQYLPQQFHHDGEQMVFIPFVNNQAQPGYSENLPLGNDAKLNYSNEDSNLLKEKQCQNTTTSDTKAAIRGKRPLSKQARAKMRKYIELKRKQRMEKAIEQKVLRKLLRNPDISKAMKESNFDEMKRKPLIKRISPPVSNKLSNNDKKINVARKGNNKDEFEDVSEDESKFDSVSDLEDVSEFEDMSDENDNYESRQLKRPVFRKPGQPRIKKALGDSSGSIASSTSGDIRKVVNQSSSQEDRRNIPISYSQPSRLKQVDVKRKPHQNEKNQRSVYIENSGENTYQVASQKRGSEVYENKNIKRRRSISPIEITVSNDHYSKVTAGSSRYEKPVKDDYDSNKRSTETYRSSSRHEERRPDYQETKYIERSFDGKYDRIRNDRKGEYKKVVDDRKYDDKKRQKKVNDEKSSKLSDRNAQSDGNGQKYTRDERNYYSGSETEGKKGMGPSRFREREQQNAGKYEVKRGDFTVEEKDMDDYRTDRGYSKNDDMRNRNERIGLRIDARRSIDEAGRNTKYTDRKRNEVRSHGLERSNEDLEYSRSDIESRNRDRNQEGNRNERNRSSSRDRNAIDDRNETQNIQVHDRRRTNISEDRTSRNIASNTFVSSMNQGQFQINQPLMQQSVQPQSFMTAQSHSVPLQFSSSSNVDHSLPPVQNAPLSIPPMPHPGLGVRPDMSLPPPMMNVVGTPTSMVIQQPNNVQFQQQPMQQVSLQQQPFQNMQFQQQQQQQQFHQMHQQPQIVQQQPGTQQFQSQQPMYQSNLQSNQQMSLQQMHSGQYQQNQNVGMVPVSQTMMQGRVNQQATSLNQGAGQGLGAGQQVIQTSMNQQTYVAANQQQALRGVLGRVRIAAPVDQVSKSPTISRRLVSGSGRTLSSNYQEDNEEDEDDYLAEMLCSKCDKVFLSHEVMRRHGRWHDMIESNTKNWRCDQCEQGFTSHSGHSEHMSSKHSRDSWNCSLCDMTFNNSSGLNKHVRQTSHKDLKVKFVCSLCPASFMVLMHLNEHKKENHQSSVRCSGLRKY